MSPKHPALLRVALLVTLLSSAPLLPAADSASATPTALPPLPPAMNIPKPGPVTDAPYAPQPILSGGVVVPLFPPN